MFLTLAVDLGAALPLWTMIPFLTMLAAIAILPLAASHWWDHNRNKAIVAVVCAVPVVIYLYAIWGAAGLHLLSEKLSEYVSFIVLLGTLFVITGGIRVDGNVDGTPLWNTGVLGIGAVLANLIGTTGAAVLLIRPLLRANEKRIRKQHVVVFFIFVVANCGGLLTPLGDPPLFLGYLKGVPFFWTLGLWKPWLLTNGILLLVFNYLDQAVFNKEELERPGSQLEEVQKHAPLRVSGRLNFVFLAAVILVILAAGMGLGNGAKPWPFGFQELLLLAITVTAYRTTPASYREFNRFRFAPIVEVAILFAGIFVAMAPALEIVNAWGRGQRLIAGCGFGLTQPGHFFWVSGLLSSVLDNAPTYLTFAATLCGAVGVPLEGQYLSNLLNQHPESASVLSAVACGSVFMGANTYIGNGPNFMIKAIAEENGVPMPTFFQYMLYSLAILIPIFLLNTWLFFPLK